MRHLFEIGSDLIKLHEQMEEHGTEDTDIDPAFGAWFDALADEEAAKLDGYVGLVKQLEMEAVAAQAEADQWAWKAKHRRDQAAWLKDRLLSHLVATKRGMVVTAKGIKIRTQPNGGQSPIVYSTKDTNDIPNDYLRTIVEIDPAQVRMALENGRELTFAKLGERGQHLRIG